MRTFAIKFTERAKQQKTLLLYSTSSLFLQATAMFSTLFALRFVSPSEMGIWRTLMLVQTYSGLISLGIPNGLSRELPFYLGKGDKARATRLAATAQFYVLLIGSIGGALLISIASLATTLPSELSFAFLAMGVLWFANQYQNYLGVTFRSNQEFHRMAVRQIACAVLNLASLIMIMIGGFNGMIFRQMLVSFLMMAFFHFIRPLRIKPHFEWHDFFLLLRTGVPQYFGSYLISISLAFEQTILLQHGGTQLVGLYTPVAAIMAVMTAISASIVSYVNPRIVYRLGQGTDSKAVQQQTIQAAGVIALITLPVVVLALFVLPPMLPLLFPKYEAAIPAIPIALVGGFFLGVNTTLTGIYALKAWRYVIIYALTALVIRWIFPWFLFKYGNTLTHVALGGALANAFIFFVGMLIVHMATRKFVRNPG